MVSSRSPRAVMISRMSSLSSEKLAGAVFAAAGLAGRALSAASGGAALVATAGEGAGDNWLLGAGAEAGAGLSLAVMSGTATGAAAGRPGPPARPSRGSRGWTVAASCWNGPVSACAGEPALCVSIDALPGTSAVAPTGVPVWAWSGGGSAASAGPAGSGTAAGCCAT